LHEEDNSFQCIATALERGGDVRGLVGTLLGLILRQTGGHRVCLLRQQTGGIAAVAVASGPSGTEFGSRPLQTCLDLPQTVIQHVARTGETLCLSGASMASFDFDPYIGRARPGFITCLPIPGLEAILYLEGSSATARAGGDLGTVRIIATFAAGAFGYARMYEELQDRAAFLQSAIDALPAHIAILDPEGTIVAVNGAWRRFADSNSLAMPNFGVGANYLKLCDSSGSRLPLARDVADGIRQVIARTKSEFFAEYDCHSPDEQRWFQVRVRPFRENGSVVVVHQSISEVKRAEADLRQALEELAQLKNQLQLENRYLQEEIERSFDFEDMVGETEEVRGVFRRVEQVAATDATVLILGETGTGKELVARAIHSRSPRKEHPLVKVNCAALPANLIESELFGHEKGAFTGALGQRLGRFEVANHGTIFLDEIGDLPLELQAKLLRVLQEGECERLGSSKPIKLDVRVIAATNHDLEKAVAESKFRSDLYYRLNVFPIAIPALRQRKKDIPLLVWHFIEKNQVKLGRKITTVPKQLMDALVQYDWPGNVRELENVIQRAVILSRGSILTYDEPLGRVAVAMPPVENNEDLEAIERAHIVKVLNECGWKIKGKANAAERLGMNPSTLRSRIQRLGIIRQTRQAGSQTTS
jgi:transcriptional regulator with PAS, ATPase and Fis domain